MFERNSTLGEVGLNSGRPLRKSSYARFRSTFTPMYVVGSAIFVLLLVMCVVASDYHIQPVRDYESNDIWFEVRRKQIESKSAKIPTHSDVENQDDKSPDVMVIRKSYLNSGDPHGETRDIVESRDILSTQLPIWNVIAKTKGRYFSVPGSSLRRRSRRGLSGDDYWRAMFGDSTATGEPLISGSRSGNYWRAMFGDITTTEEPLISGSGSGGCENSDDEDCVEPGSGSGSGDVELPESTTQRVTRPLTTTQTIRVTRPITTTQARMTTTPTTTTANLQTTPLPTTLAQQPTSRVYTTEAMTTAPMTSASSPISTLIASTSDDVTLFKSTIPKDATESRRETTTEQTTPRADESTDEDLKGGPMDKEPWFSGMRAGMIIGVAALVVLAAVTVYFAYKCRNRDKGSYSIDESRNYVSNTTTGNTIIMSGVSNGKEAQDGVANPTTPSKGDSKELYV